MSIHENVKRLIELVEQKKFLEALREFYAEDASMQENDDPPRVGLKHILENERRAMASFQEMHVTRASSFLVDGDRAAINWVFEYTDKNGRRHRLDEVAYQVWRDGKIIGERFYYDPAQRRIEITPEGWPFERIELAATA